MSYTTTYHCHRCYSTFKAYFSYDNVKCGCGEIALPVGHEQRRPLRSEPLMWWGVALEQRCCETGCDECKGSGWKPDPRSGGLLEFIHLYNGRSDSFGESVDS